MPSRRLVMALLTTVGLIGCQADPPLSPSSPPPTMPVDAPSLPTAQANVWATRAGMPAARTGLAVGVVNNVLHAVGGANGVTYLATHQAYAPGTNTWTAKAPMPQGRHLLNGRPRGRRCRPRALERWAW
jgi:hypothetical protein